MIFGSTSNFGFRPVTRTTTLLSVVFFLFISAADVSAQRRFSRAYSAGQNVRLQLMNRSGTVTVEGWDRAEIAISATLESPAAVIIPQSLSGTIVINVVRDNQGKNEDRKSVV